MEINDIRSAVTVVGFILFGALVGRTWRRKSHAGHERAARLVFEGEVDSDGVHPSEGRHHV